MKKNASAVWISPSAARLLEHPHQTVPTTRDPTTTSAATSRRLSRRCGLFGCAKPRWRAIDRSIARCAGRPVGTFTACSAPFLATEVVDFEVWAPAVSSLAVRVNGDARARARRRGFWRGAAAAQTATTTSRRRRRPARPLLAVAARGVLGPSTCSTPRVRSGAATCGGCGSTSSCSTSCTSGRSREEATFDGAIPHLRALAELGVTAVEVMPIATFPGRRGWGYDGLYTSAPHEAYGGPEGFARFVDAAHDVGLGVVLDVVYNHVGPGARRCGAFGPYFTDRHETFWGEALDYSQRGVREWAIQNAELWVRDYRRRRPAPRRGARGLRRPAAHVLAELAERVRAIDPRALVTAEMDDGRPAADRGVGTRRAVGRRAPPRAARAADRRARGLLRATTARSRASPPSCGASRPSG